MEQGPRRSNRRPLLRRDDDFIYEDEIIENTATGELHISEVWQRRTASSYSVARHLNADADGSHSDGAIAEGSAHGSAYASRSYSDTSIYTSHINSIQVSGSPIVNSVQSLDIASRSRIYSHHWEGLTFVDGQSADFVNGSGDRRRFSSTRGDVRSLRQLLRSLR